MQFQLLRLLHPSPDTGHHALLKNSLVDIVSSSVIIWAPGFPGLNAAPSVLEALFGE